MLVVCTVAVTNTHALQMTKLLYIHDEATLRILRQVCMEEQVVMYKLTDEHRPAEYYHGYL